MDRRESLKFLALGAFSTGLVLEACQTADKKAPPPAAPSIDRMQEEKQAYERLLQMPHFFTPDEMATISVLADIIIPADGKSGSATDAKVPDFIEFMVKERPEMQVPMRGGLRWLEMKSVQLYGKSFRELPHDQRIAIVDAIAYPKRAKPEAMPGVAFFSLLRNLTASGFYTSQIGLKDVGYIGNQPNQWNGVPDDVLAQYGIAYTEKEMKECVHFG